MDDKSLDRRDALKLAAGAVLVGAQADCAPARGPATAADVTELARRLDPAAADALLARIDRRMDALGNASLPESVLPLRGVARDAEFDRTHEEMGALVRKSVRTLYMTGQFLDMSDELKMHPAVQSRMWAMQGEMDEAVLGMTTHLERMTADDHRRVQTYLQDDPDFGERLAHVLEDTAVEDGLSRQRSLGVRSSILQLAGRMSAQSPGLVVDPLVSKVRRIQARPRDDAEDARRRAARVGEEAFWESQDRIAVLHQAWTARLGPTSPFATTAAAAPAPSATGGSSWASDFGSTGPAATPTPSPKVPTAGERTVSTGGITMGFGLGSVALGAIFAGIAAGTSSSSIALIGPALFFGVTLGPILLVVGLVIVIVGLAMKASE